MIYVKGAKGQDRRHALLKIYRAWVMIPILFSWYGRFHAMYLPVYALLLTGLLIIAGWQIPKPIVTVASVDLQRFMGDGCESELADRQPN